MKTVCKDCKGGGICEHNKRKERCWECPRCCICRTSTASREGTYGLMCFQCAKVEENIRLSTTRNVSDILRLLQEQGGIKASRQIELKAVHKKQEQAIKVLLQDNIAGPSTRIVHDQGVLQSDSACDGSRRRPDFQILHKHQEHLDIWVEVDEFQHLRNGAYVCELGRINEMVFWARTVQRPCVVVRINLDAFTTPRKPSSTPLSKRERYPVLLRVLRELMDEARGGMPAFALKIVHLFFDCPAGCDGGCGGVHARVYRDALEVARDVAVAT